jgi:hypothetical protein
MNPIFAMLNGMEVIAILAINVVMFAALAWVVVKLAKR